LTASTREMSPRHTGCLARPGSGGASAALCPRFKRDGTAGEVGRLPRSRLTEIPTSRRPAGHGGWRGRDAPSARGASLASSAALLTHRATLLTRPNFRAATPTSFPTSTPTSFPTRWGCVPLASLPSASVLSRSCPYGGVERTGRKERFARLIQRRVRAFWPAFGRRRLRRHQIPPRLLLTVVG